MFDIFQNNTVEKNDSFKTYELIVCMLFYTSHFYNLSLVAFRIRTFTVPFYFLGW